jgi:hypothetical protein
MSRGSTVVVVDGPVVVVQHFTENRSCIAFDLSDQVLYRVWVGAVVDVVEVL